MTHTFLLGVILSIIHLGQTSNSSYQCKDTGCITHFANQDLEAECVYVLHANWTSIGEKYNLSTTKEDGLCDGECCRCLKISPPSQPTCNDVRGHCQEAFEGAGTCIDVRTGDLSNIDINVEPLEGICGTELKNCCQCFKLKKEVVPVNTSTPTNTTSTTTTTPTTSTTTTTCVVNNGPCEMCNTDADCQPGAGCFWDPPLSNTRVCHCKLGYYLDNSTSFSCPHTGTCVDFRTSTCVSDAQAVSGPTVNELSRDGCLIDSRGGDPSAWGICPYCRAWRYAANHGGYISLGTYVSGEGDPETGDPMVFENGGDVNCPEKRSSIAYWYCWYDFVPSTTVSLDYVEIMWSEDPLCYYQAYIYTPLACYFDL